MVNFEHMRATDNAHDCAATTMRNCCGQCACKPRKPSNLIFLHFKDCMQGGAEIVAPRAYMIGLALEKMTLGQAASCTDPTS